MKKEPNTIILSLAVTFFRPFLYAACKFENIYILDTEGPTPPTCKNIKFKKMIKYFPKQLDLEFSDVVLKYNN